uniref:Uncharacterized protein n=1 Tax=candidate division WOR-3 bacterium TaxID=2052148 RepID=A0A7C4GHF1_UNCW3
MKTRVIVWTVVAILVLLVVVLLLSSGRRGRIPVVQLSDLQRRAAAVEAKLAERASEIVRIKATPVANPQALADAEKHLAEATALVQKVKESDNVRQADADLRSAHRLITRLNRELRLAVKTKRTGAP